MENEFSGENFSSECSEGGEESEWSGAESAGSDEELEDSKSEDSTYDHVENEENESEVSVQRGLGTFYTGKTIRLEKRKLSNGVRSDFKEAERGLIIC